MTTFQTNRVALIAPDDNSVLALNRTDKWALQQLRRTYDESNVMILTNLTRASKVFENNTPKAVFVCYDGSNRRFVEQAFGMVEDVNRKIKKVLIIPEGVQISKDDLLLFDEPETISFSTSNLFRFQLLDLTGGPLSDDEPIKPRLNIADIRAFAAQAFAQRNASPIFSVVAH